jgi:uncharacterized protein
MNRVVRFDLQVAEPEKAIEFYSTTFGWSFTKIPDQEYWFISTGASDAPGIDGGLMKSPDGVARTTNSIEVPSVDEYLKKVVKTGGAIVVPKITMPGLGYLAYCVDPHGTIFGVSQTDPEAK